MSDKELPQDLVDWITTKMEELDVSAAEIARRAKMNPASVWKILNRKVEPKRNTLEQLAKALGTKLPPMGVVSGNDRDNRHENRPDVPPARRSVREEPSGYPSAAGEEDAAYLRTALEVSRALSNADRESLPLAAKLRLIDLAEKVMVPVYGKRAKTFLDDERARLRGGEAGS